MAAEEVNPTTLPNVVELLAVSLMLLLLALKTNPDERSNTPDNHA